MPVYEYACKACGRHVEVAQSFKDEPLTTCEVCGGPLRKVFGTIGVVLKGSGFYRTDSRNESRARKGDKAEKAEKADKADKGDKGEKVAAKSDSSKSESKSEGSSGANSDSKPKAADTAKSA